MEHPKPVERIPRRKLWLPGIWRDIYDAESVLDKEKLPQFPPQLQGRGGGVLERRSDPVRETRLHDRGHVREAELQHPELERRARGQDNSEEGEERRRCSSE